MSAFDFTDSLIVYLWSLLILVELQYNLTYTSPDLAPQFAGIVREEHL